MITKPALQKHTQEYSRKQSQQSKKSGRMNASSKIISKIKRKNKGTDHHKESNFMNK